MTKPVQVSIIGGGGMVGAATAFAMMARNVPADILLVDVVELMARGHAYDIADASFTQHGVCRVGTFAEAGQSDLVIITAGVPQKPGEARSALLGKNKAIMRDICKNMAPIRKDMKILVVANPCDVMTHVVQKESGLPQAQVFGSGTYLDSGRLRCALGEMLDVHPSSIDALVLGEHGDRQFVNWSAAKIGGQPLLAHPKMQNVDLNEIKEQVMRRAYTIIEAKRSTYFGIGMCACEIAVACLTDSRRVFPLVNYHPTEQVYMSWPCSIGRSGVEQVFNCPLSESESKCKDVAVAAIKEMVAEADKQ